MRTIVWGGAGAADITFGFGIDVEAEADMTGRRLENDMATGLGGVTARGGVESGIGAVCRVVSYGKQVWVGVGSRSSRRATVAAMNFGLCPRTKAIYIRFVR
jgi:hypothetical protein